MEQLKLVFLYSGLANFPQGIQKAILDIERYFRLKKKTNSIHYYLFKQISQILVDGLYHDKVKQETMKDISFCSFFGELDFLLWNQNERSSSDLQFII